MGGLIPGADPKHASIGQLANLNQGFDNNQNQLGIYQQALQAAQAAQNGQAPVAQAAGIGPAPTMQAATVNPAALYGGANINLGQANDQYGNENAVIGALGGLAQGNDSLAQGQLTQATQQNLSQLAGSAASQAGAGVSPGMALQSLLAAQGTANQNAALQSAQTRVGEQQSALGQLSSLVPTVAAQQQGLATNQAQLIQSAMQGNQQAINTLAQQQSAQQQAANAANQQVQAQYGSQASAQQQATNLANAANFLTNQGQQYQQQQAMLNTGLTAAQTANQNQQAGQQLQAQQGEAQAGVSQSANNQEAQTSGAVAGAIAAGAGTGAGLASKSDPDDKENVTSGDTDIAKYLDALSDPKSYNYKDPSSPGAAPGRFTSPMSDDLKASTVGSQFVFPGTDGKDMIDFTPQHLGTILAGLGYLNKKLNEKAA